MKYKKSFLALFFFILINIMIITLFPFAQTLTWEKTYGGSGNDYATCIIETLGNGYAAAGWTDSKGTGNRDGWVFKLNEYGEILWEKTFGGDGDDRVNSILQNNDGDYLLAGWTDSKGSGGGDAWIFKLNREGDMLQGKTYGGIGYDRAESIIQTSDGGYMFVGHTKPKGIGGFDAWILKLDEECNLR